MFWIKVSSRVERNAVVDASVFMFEVRNRICRKGLADTPYVSISSIAYRLAVRLSSVSVTHKYARGMVTAQCNCDFGVATFWLLHVPQAFLGRPALVEIMIYRPILGFKDLCNQNTVCRDVER